jgi:hypothetical protein
VTGFQRWFDSTPGSRVDPEILRLSQEKKLYVSTKQVPSCLAVRKPGSFSIKKNLDDLLDLGFPISISTAEGWLALDGPSHSEGKHLSASQVSSLHDYMSSIKIDNERTHPSAVEAENPLYRPFSPSSEGSEDSADALNEGASSGGSSDFSFDNPFQTRKPIFRLDYQDVWKNHAAKVYALRTGKTGPEVYVFEADVIRLSDPIHPRLMGPAWTGGGRRGIPFYDIASTDVKQYIVLNRTHWGKYLSESAADETLNECHFARRLIKRLKSFLAGRHDPAWTKQERVKTYGEGYKLHDTRSRSTRLLQLLMTVDGVFEQRYLACPNEAWNWKKFDRFIVVVLDALLGDEFYDGEIQDKEALGLQTAYARLKGLRQQFKQAAGLETVNELLETLDASSAEDVLYRALKPAWGEYLRTTDGQDRLRIQTVLSQTRGAGTPPPLVLLQVKRDFLVTVSEKPAPLEREERLLIRATLEQIMLSIPDEAFTGLRTKAGVKATTSACYEKTRQEGGTAQAVQDIVYEGTLGRLCKIVDLETGAHVEDKYLDECTPGEYIFWVCLEEVLATAPEELKKTYLLVVNEPGKGRSVTKGHACLKIVLDVVNGICSWPLQKGVPSSRSGMGKESHGWNLFKSFFQDMKEIVFREKEISREFIDESSWYTTKTYQDVWVLSTDFKTATDFMHHEVARETGGAWMQKCGIPALLRGIVMATCYSERDVYFTATGLLADAGVATDEENVRKIRLVRGVLMGDPLTKPVLHLVNMAVRELSQGVEHNSWLIEACTNAGDIVPVFAHPSERIFFPPPRRMTA